MDGEPKRGADAVEDRWRKGPWTPQEDKLLAEHVNLHGGGRWNSVSKLTGNGLHQLLLHFHRLLLLDLCRRIEEERKELQTSVGELPEA